MDKPACRICKHQHYSREPHRFAAGMLGIERPHKPLAAGSIPVPATKQSLKAKASSALSDVPLSDAPKKRGRPQLSDHKLTPAERAKAYRARKQGGQG